MIVLDTNVVSELIRRRPSDAVLAWLDAQEGRRAHLTAVSVAELRHGVARLPGGGAAARSMLLSAACWTRTSMHGSSRSTAPPRTRTLIVVERERSGRPISQADAQIAAICRAREATLATRNGRDFERTGVGVVDPWTASPAR